MTYQKFMFDRSFDVDNPTSEEIEIIKDEEKEPEIIVPTFSEKEVQAARSEGFEKGKVEALKEAATAIENQIVDATKVISAQLDQLTSNQSLANRDIFLDAIKVSRAITAKSFPSINAENGFQEVENLIRYALSKILEEPRVKIQIHPTLTEQLSERINQISENTHFEGRILIFADEAIEQGDCKIEWGSGGAERNVNDIIFEIDAIINTNLAFADEGYEPNPNSFDDKRIDPLTPPIIQSSESSTLSDMQSSLNETNQAEIPADNAELTVPEEVPPIRSDSVSTPTEKDTQITQKTAKT